MAAGIMGRISRTWSAMGSSWIILQQDKELLLFTLLSGLCTLGVAASFITPLFMKIQAGGGEQLQAMQNDPLFYAWLLLFYFCCHFVITFFNSAVVGCAILRMEGNNPTLADGFRIAFGRLWEIAGWALLAASVGVLLRAIESRSRGLARLAAGLFGVAFSLASFLVVPVIVVEGVGPFSALKESASFIKQTWGEQVVSNISYGAIFFLLGLPGALAVFLGISAGGGLLILSAAGVLYLLLLALLQATLYTIFQAAMYVYVTEGSVSFGFSESMLSEALG